MAVKPWQFSLCQRENSFLCTDHSERKLLFQSFWNRWCVGSSSTSTPSTHTFTVGVCYVPGTGDRALKSHKTQPPLCSSEGNGHQSVLMAAGTSAITRWAQERRSDPRSQVRDTSLGSKDLGGSGVGGPEAPGRCRMESCVRDDRAGNVGWATADSKVRPSESSPLPSPRVTGSGSNF